jgi:hypothetical protein
MGWPVGLYIDATKGSPTDNNIPATLFVQNTIIAGCPTPVLYGASTTSPTGATTASISAWFNTPAFGNSILATNTEVGLTNPFNYTNPDFNPTAGSAAAAGANFGNAKLNGLNSVNYKGACAVGDSWWKTWTKFM